MAGKYITAAFTIDDEPVEGLSPTIRIRDVSIQKDVTDSNLIITDAAMYEVGDGVYAYFFSTYDSNKNYAVRIDAGIDDVDIKYMFGGNENFKEDIQEDILSAINDIVGGGAVASFD